MVCATVSEVRNFDYKTDIFITARKVTVFLCSNRPTNSHGVADDEIQYALGIGKPMVSVRVTDSTNSIITSLGIPIVAKRKDTLENWILRNI